LRTARCRGTARGGVDDCATGKARSMWILARGASCADNGRRARCCCCGMCESCTDSRPAGGEQLFRRDAVRARGFAPKEVAALTPDRGGTATSADTGHDASCGQSSAIEFDTLYLGERRHPRPPRSAPAVYSTEDDDRLQPRRRLPSPCTPTTRPMEKTLLDVLPSHRYDEARRAPEGGRTRAPRVCARPIYDFFVVSSMPLPRPRSENKGACTPRSTLAGQNAPTTSLRERFVGCGCRCT